MNRPAQIDTIQAAAARRAVVLQSRTLDAWRVLNGPADGAPAGVTLDRYGDWLVLSARDSVPPEVSRAWASAALQSLPAKGLVLKTIAKRGATSVLFDGLEPPQALSIREEDATLLCELNDGAQTGLFLDHRETRLYVRRFASGARVLNLFAYTCAFSVHAALAGAAVTSVDISKRALRRGRANMEASKLDPSAHRWFPEDVLGYLRRAPKRPFELVIADPPVFGRAKNRTFTLADHLDALAGGLIQQTASSGILVFSTHALNLSVDRIESSFRRAAREAGRSVSVEATMGLPAWDHPVRQAANDRGDYLKTLVLRVA